MMRFGLLPLLFMSARNAAKPDSTSLPLAISSSAPNTIRASATNVLRFFHIRPVRTDRLTLRPCGQFPVSQILSPLDIHHDGNVVIIAVDGSYENDINQDLGYCAHRNTLSPGKISSEFTI